MTEYFTCAPDEPPGVDGTPGWAYSEDGYCVCCGNGRWKYHMPDCHLREALDALAKRDSTMTARKVTCKSPICPKDGRCFSFKLGPQDVIHCALCPADRVYVMPPGTYTVTDELVTVPAPRLDPQIAPESG